MLVALGGELCALHLLESPKVGEYITTFLVAGTNEVEKVTVLDSPRGGVVEDRGGLSDAPSWAMNSLFPYWSLPKNHALKERSRALRKQGILSEVLFWQACKDKKSLGWDIDRQVIIGNYIVDFLIPELGLVFEIDGSSHEGREEYDTERDAFLTGLQLQIVRIVDSDVRHHMDGVMILVHESIMKRVESLKKSTPSPLVGTPQGGESPKKYLDIYINSTQYFGDVPLVAWEFYIGGYQPAQKWLKDRKGRTLTWEDIAHYQSMIVALTETSRVMGEVDRVLEV